jgi:hypothetical protein
MSKKYVILIDRGYIHYSDCINGVTEFGTTLFKEDAKTFSQSQSSRIASKIRKKGEKCTVIETGIKEKGCEF